VDARMAARDRPPPGTPGLLRSVRERAAAMLSPSSSARRRRRCCGSGGCPAYGARRFRSFMRCIARRLIRARRAGAGRFSITHRDSTTIARMPPCARSFVRVRQGAPIVLGFHPRGRIVLGRWLPVYERTGPAVGQYTEGRSCTRVVTSRRSGRPHLPCTAPSPPCRPR
jgi:hypothetical protein